MGWLAIPQLPGPGKKKQPDPTQGFNVFVKDRVYVKGKKKYQEKFLRMNKKPLNYNDARNLGMAAVDNSAAATFKVQKAKGLAKKPSIVIPITNPNKFYVRNNKNIEKRSYRIDSLGELKQITAKGWLAQQQKALNGIVSTKKPGVSSKKKGYKPFSTGKGSGFPSVEQSMQQFVRGLKI